MSNAAQTLRSEVAACRLSFTWFGTKKSLTKEQLKRAAEVFGADDDNLSGSSKIINTKHPAFKVLTSIKGRANADWRFSTMPYVEDGIRLCKRSEMGNIQSRVTGYRGELREAVYDLQIHHYENLLEQAKHDRGELYDRSHYPETLEGQFDMEIDFPSFEPPPWMETYAPALYAQQQALVAAKMEQSVVLWEQEVVSQVHKLVTHFAEICTDGPEGKKRLHSTAVTNLHEAVKRFKDMNIGSDAQLDAIMEQINGTLGGTTIKDIKDGAALRAELAQTMSKIGEHLESRIVTPPRRRIAFMSQVEAIATPAAVPA